MRMARTRELRPILVPSGLNESPEQSRLIGVGVLNVARERLDQFVDGQEVEVPSDRAAVPIDATPQSFEIAPHARRIAADDERLSLILASNLRQLGRAVSVLPQKPVQPRIRKARNG